MFWPKAASLVALGIVLRSGCGAPRPLTQKDAAAYEASLAATTQGAIVAWHDSRESPSVLEAVSVDRKGRVRARHRLTDGPHSAWEADVGALADGFVVAWYETPRGGSDRALVARFSSDGSRLWQRQVSIRGQQGRNPVVLPSGDGVFVAWLDRGPTGAHVWGRSFDANGDALIEPTKIAEAGATTWNLNADRDGEGQIWLVFDAASKTRAAEIYLARLSDSGASLGIESTVRVTRNDGAASAFPDIAVGKETLALTWFDERDGNNEVYLYTGPHSTLGEEPVDDSAFRVTYGEGDSIGAYVAWNGAGYGLAWSDFESGSYDIFFRPFSKLGAPRGTARRLTRNSTASLIPAIQPHGKRFALVWNEDVEDERPSHLIGGRSHVVLTTVSWP